MIVRRNGFHNGIMAGESTIHRIFVACVVFMKAILSCLNIKSHDGNLPYCMIDLFNKTGQGLTDIIVT